MGNGKNLFGIIGAAMISTVAVVAPFTLFSAPASADTIHVNCTQIAPNCVDNGSITPTSLNPATFSFDKQGGADLDTGTFFVEVLIPNNVGSAASLNFSLTGTNTGVGLLNSSVFSATAWTSGQLDAYLTRSATPTNPIGAFLPLTQTYQPGATGYYVYDFNFGSVNFGVNDPSFTVGTTLPVGTIVAAFLHTCKKNDACTAPNDWVGTPNSAALILTDGGKPPVLPEPATLSLVGAGLIGVRYLRRKRKA